MIQSSSMLSVKMLPQPDFRVIVKTRPQTVREVRDVRLKQEIHQQETWSKEDIHRIKLTRNWKSLASAGNGLWMSSQSAFLTARTRDQFCPRAWTKHCWKMSQTMIIVSND